MGPRKKIFSDAFVYMIATKYPIVMIMILIHEVEVIVDKEMISQDGNISSRRSWSLLISMVFFYL